MTQVGYHKGLHVFSILVYCIQILVQVVFCFKMKELGFSVAELGIIYLLQLLLAYVVGSVCLSSRPENISMILISVIIMEIVMLQSAAMYTMTDFIKVIFMI